MVKRILFGVIGLIVCTVIAGAVYQVVASAADEDAHPMPGKRIDVGGRSLHLYCSGDGATTAVLENGLTANYTTWRLVQRDLQQTMRVCSYDRASMGYSDASTHPTQAEFVASDLRALLTAASVPPPYVLVGWSAGGVFVRRYLRDYPVGVVGMVLVDSSHEQQQARLPATERSRRDEAGLMDQLELCSAIAWTGAVRVSGAMALLTDRLSLPADLAAEMLAMANRSSYCTGVLREIEGFSIDTQGDAPATLGNLPLVVLTRGRKASADDFPGDAPDPDFIAAMDRVWTALQIELAALSSQASHRIVQGSGHSIPLEAPDAVTTAVRDVLALGYDRPSDLD